MEMIDYLLKFNTKQEAIVFAEQMGFTTDVEDGNGIEVTIPMTQSDTHVFTVIGEHIMPTGETETIVDETGMEWQSPITVSDGKHWVLFRDVKGDMDSEPAEDFIEWASDQTERVRRRDEDGQFLGDDPDTTNDEAWEDVPVPRPDNAPNRVFL
jgi:hypothetical protein